jgi:hypothetical protein
VADDFWTTPEAICWAMGFNGTCDGYARGHATCGGDEYTTDSPGECHAFCRATSGAWMDDLDTICTDECGDLCSEAEDICYERCGETGLCYYQCLEEHGCS